MPVGAVVEMRDISVLMVDDPGGRLVSDCVNSGDVNNFNVGNFVDSRCSASSASCTYAGRGARMWRRSTSAKPNLDFERIFRDAV